MTLKKVVFKVGKNDESPIVIDDVPAEIFIPKQSPPKLTYGLYQGLQSLPKTDKLSPNFAKDEKPSLKSRKKSSKQSEAKIKDSKTKVCQLYIIIRNINTKQTVFIKATRVDFMKVTLFWPSYRLLVIELKDILCYYSIIAFIGNT